MVRRWRFQHFSLYLSSHVFHIHYGTSLEISTFLLYSSSHVFHIHYGTSLRISTFLFIFIFTRISYPLWYVAGDFNISLYIYLHTYFISIMVRRWRFQHFYYIHLHTYFISIMVRRWRFQHFSLYLSSHVFHIHYGTSLEISIVLFIFIFTRISYPLWYVAGDSNISTFHKRG